MSLDISKGFFPITNVHRLDLLDNGWTRDEAEAMTDDDMKDVACFIRDHVMESGVYWDAINEYSRLKEDL